MNAHLNSRSATAVAAGVLSIVCVLLLTNVYADEPRFVVGVRGTILTAGGEPTNDQMGPGIYGKYRLNDKWLVGAAIDQLSGDFERPYKLFGNSSPEEIDSTADYTILSAWAEREYGREDSKLKWFWSSGLGFTSPDVDNVSGPITGGGTFDIRTDAGTEILISGVGGLRRPISKRFGFETGIRLDHHFADWKLRDLDNATTAKLSDYTTWGLHLGISATF